MPQAAYRRIRMTRTSLGRYRSLIPGRLPGHLLVGRDFPTAISLPKRYSALRGRHTLESSPRPSRSDRCIDQPQRFQELAREYTFSTWRKSEVLGARDAPVKGPPAAKLGFAPGC